MAAAIDTMSYGRVVVAESDEKDVGETIVLPPYDASEGTSLKLYIAIGAGTAFSLACIISAAIFIARNPFEPVVELRYRRYRLRPMEFEAFSLLVNLALTFVTDTLSFIHSVSLRWALAHEGRLEFNTNLRLLTSSRAGGPNSWWVNILSLATLMLCYGSTSTLFLSNIEDLHIEISGTTADDNNMCRATACANMVALGTLGVGLAAQTAIAAWCLVSGRRKIAHNFKAIPTWSSSPLNATLTSLHGGLVTRQDGRCMVSVHQRNDAPTEGGVVSSKRQGYVWSVHRAVRYVVYYLWGLSVVAVLWPVIIAAVVIEFTHAPAFSWTPDRYSAVVMAMSPAENIGQDNRAVAKGAYFSFAGELVLGVVFVTAIQALQTTGLHATELLASLSRDEAAWRSATTKRGATYMSEPFLAALLSWENIVLFLAKSVLHWIIGQGMSPQVATILTFSKEKKGAMFFVMSWSRLIVFAACAIFMAVFATYLARRRPSGPQPAAWGHLQTLADLVDDWTLSKKKKRRCWFAEEGKFWWGDKPALLLASGGMVVRHAGMKPAQENVEEIMPEERYAGYEGRARHWSL